jgi:hypothetical protein
MAAIKAGILTASTKAALEHAETERARLLQPTRNASKAAPESGHVSAGPRGAILEAGGRPRDGHSHEVDKARPLTGAARRVNPAPRGGRWGGALPGARGEGGLFGAGELGVRL